MLDIVTATEAKDEIKSLIEKTAESHRPILITAENNNAVLLSEEDWNALQETLQLLSTKGMRESILEEVQKSNDEFLSEAEFLSALEKDGKI